MPTPFTGPAGEHYIIYRLIRKEYVAGLASENAPNTDIIVTNKDGAKAIAVQVKTRRPLGKNNGWQMKAKHENIKGDRLFYCFVDLKEEIAATPDVYIIPSKVVADVVKETHRLWYQQPGRGGRQRNKETTMRWIVPDFRINLNLEGENLKKYGPGWMDKYKENWKILDLD